MDTLGNSNSVWRTEVCFRWTLHLRTCEELAGWLYAFDLFQVSEYA